MNVFLNRFDIFNTNQFEIQGGRNTSDGITIVPDEAFEVKTQNRALTTVFLGFSEVLDTADQEKK